MRNKAAEPQVLTDRHQTDDAAHQLAARCAGLNLDAETLELLLAVLATDVCDHLTLDGNSAGPDA